MYTRPFLGLKLKAFLTKALFCTWFHNQSEKKGLRFLANDRTQLRHAQSVLVSLKSSKRKCARIVSEKVITETSISKINYERLN